MTDLRILDPSHLSHSGHNISYVQNCVHIIELYYYYWELVLYYSELIIFMSTPITTDQYLLLSITIDSNRGNASKGNSQNVGIASGKVTVRF